VADALQDKKWTKGLQRVTTMDEINQFIGLWIRVRQTSLTAQDDEIS
jgi:hypothetical protein